MTFTWWLVPIIGLGTALVLAPMIGVWLARRDVWTTCPRCGVDLVGSPPEHLERDRYWCRLIYLAKEEGL